ncbi:MAG TPA: hypothetical protein VNO30_27550 [Kofleriaceae bacterium]|nr:hypothetical protein [Kofleriaceae bacterium]
MRRRYLLLAASVAAAAAVLALRARGEAPAAVPTAQARTARFAVPGQAGQTVARARYRLAFEQQVTVPGKGPIQLRAEGTWTSTPRADGRAEVRFSPALLDGPASELPRTADLDAPAQLVREGGTLTAIGFPDEMPAAARKLLTGLATTFQCSERPGAGWTAVEEDLTGRYEAVYVRQGGGIDRTRPRYTALRGPGGLSAESTGDVTPTEESRFVVDADGIVTARVALDVAFAIGKGAEPVRLRLRASLAREAIERVPVPGGATLAAGPISGFADYEGARRNADASFVAGATVPDLLAEVKRAAAMSGRAGGNARAQVLARLAALVRLEPEAAEEIADHVRLRPGDDAEVQVLTGALASTRVAAGTDALASLAAEELPEAARLAVLGALSFSSPVTPASLRALTAGLDRPGADQAALGLGTHGRKTRAQDPAAADAAIDALLARHARAAGDAERKLYLEALGNGGAARALPVLRAAIDGGDRQLGSAAVFSLRFVPGADADALIERSIARPALAFAAIRAAAYRDPARFAPLLRDAQQRYADHNGIQGEIQAILRRWG